MAQNLSSDGLNHGCLLSLAYAYRGADRQRITAIKWHLAFHPYRTLPSYGCEYLRRLSLFHSRFYTFDGCIAGRKPLLVYLWLGNISTRRGMDAARSRCGSRAVQT